MERNKSKTYSAKLYKTFQKQLLVVQKSPDIGTKTNMKDVRGLIVLDYTLFYEVTDNSIIVHTVWDNRQNPKDQKIKK
ncbi:type II toxin-antitoxin system RelE/ParE family toxin [Flavobacterium sp. DG1-102-2]|uniref:type II toxin-antitoxin system RelE/ParE family toxin n=1 Tax=Flavobacterium sp. DG1-102-2 TaxID=3081663 RepID=UPI003982A5AC